MTIKHHPSDATLIAYGAGTLSEGLSLVVATHLSLCPDCRHTMGEIETLGGAMLDELPPAPLDEDVLDAVLGRLDDTPPPTPAPAPQQRTVPLPEGALALPEPLASRIGSLAEAQWRRLVPGIRHIDLLPQRRGEGTLRLLQIAPGTALPAHGHQGTELTLVLSGSFADETGRFGPGDMGELDEDSDHQPIADREVACICLIATEAPLRFQRFLPRLMQPFLRF